MRQVKYTGSKKIKIDLSKGFCTINPNTTFSLTKEDFDVLFSKKINTLIFEEVKEEKKPVKKSKKKGGK